MLKRFAATLLTLLIFTGFVVSASGTEQSYVINLENKKQEIPLAYTVKKTYSYFNLEKDTLSAPTDLYVDKYDQLYILDAGNGRVVKLDVNGNILKEYCPGGADALNKPSGIFVDGDQNIYIADTDNGRIVRMDKDGNINLRLTQPTSSLYDSAYPFKPIKVEVDSLGQVYVLNSLDYHGFTILDMNNQFKGYLAASQLSSNLWDKIIDRFATGAQKDKLGKRIPPTHTNFTIGTDGSLYTTTGNVDTQQFKQYSTVGNNYYPKKDSFGDNSVDYIMQKFGKTMEKPDFVDVCVDAQGVISLLDNLSGRIYQYDRDGVMLCAFGGTGNWAGRFMNAVAMDNDSKGNLYVLDQNLNTVQVFQPTRFIRTVQQALDLYNNGKYVEAQDLWQQILVSDSSYPVANIGLGKAELKQDNYEKAMEYYKIAGDKEGYSNAFKGYSKIVVRRYFLLIVFGIVAVLVLLYIVVGRIYRTAKRLGSCR